MLYDKNEYIIIMVLKFKKHYLFKQKYVPSVLMSHYKIEPKTITINQ